MLMLIKAQQDVLNIKQGWQGKFIETGGREVVGIFHVTADNARIRVVSSQCSFA